MKLRTLAFVGWLFDDDMDCRRDGIDFSWPRLTHLQLIPEAGQPAIMYRDSNIRRKVSHLTHLSISNGNQHHLSQLTHILQFCPLLIHLGIAIHGSSANHGELFDNLTFSRDAPRLLLLRELGIHISVENHLCWSPASTNVFQGKTLASLRAMVESRTGTQNVPTTLERLIISVGGVPQFKLASVAADAIEELLKSVGHRPAVCRVVRKRATATATDLDSTFDGAFGGWRGTRVSDIIEDFGALGRI
ncbi:hypothetical protein NMY22_g19377 [Coprinellus aureogranulatus]|nr:hypothetical protein NMY22_g19377 [Coprinellus aureogranulatus]